VVLYIVIPLIGVAILVYVFKLNLILVLTNLYFSCIAISAVVGYVLCKSKNENKGGTILPTSTTCVPGANASTGVTQITPTAEM